MADPSTPQRKVSRYRSQRQKAQQAAEDAPQVPDVPENPSAHQDDSITRSKSRYHRKNAGAGSRPATAHDQDQSNLASRPGTKARSPPPVRYNQLDRTYTPPSKHHDRPMEGYRQRQLSDDAELGAHDVRRAQDDQHDSGVETERRAPKRPDPVPVSSLSRSPPSEQPTIAELFPPPSFEPAEPAPRTPPRQDGPPTSDQIRATKADPPRYVDDEDESEGGCFGLFKRKRGEAAPNAREPPIARPPTSREPQAILAGGGGVVPLADAPVSAVNAGDRRVLVECGRSRMLFPVTPTTTPIDLIRSASTTMSERIDPKSAVLLEYFGTVGVQRPMRRYEHIRDVMNSWDTDRQNTLILVDPGTGSSETELSLAGAPKIKPQDASWLLTYSQRPGKWEKRFITLKTDGQITCQKSPDKPQDQINICHMSDFDIYTPTQEQLRKKIKPPKKLCFAIKSQQKSSMFESTQNFVHFFCSGDRRTADDFHEKVQAWRSWYLVNVMGEGRKPNPTTADEKPDGGISTSFTAQGHRKMDSLDSHYQLGSFKPLVNMDTFDNKRPGTSDRRSASADEHKDRFDPDAPPVRRASTRRKPAQKPPAAFDRQVQLAEDEPLVNLARQPTLDNKRTSLDQTRPLSSEEFAPSGLLGRSYSQRAREAPQADQTPPPPRRQPSTRANGDIRRATSTRDRNRTSVDLQRGSSRRGREPPKPLIDLTPTPHEPPQFSKRNKGHGHETDLPPGSLIEAATSPEDALNIPASTDWRGRNNSSNNVSKSVSPAGARARSRSRPGERRPTTSRTRSENNSPFTGEGLLAGSVEGWGGGTKGRGVIDGSRARGPMVDLRQDNTFAQGSLLARQTG